MISPQNELLLFLRMLRPAQTQHQKIRIGALGDGGYVLPNDLAGIQGVISIGIGDEVSFDSFFSEMGVPVYQYDPTVSAPPVSGENFHFRSVAWSSMHSFQSRTLDTILEENELTRCSDLLLKFDAEGAEWDAFDKQKEETLKQFRVIVGEFHGLHQLADSAFLRLASEVFSKLTIFHTAVHLHANNCCGFVLIEGIPIPKVVEITFLRNDRSNTFEPSRDPIPSALDYPNMPSRPDLHLNPFG